ncbi:MAG: hypothetical protein ABEJ61_08535 [Haloferacaceae archaeon]
MSMRTAVSQAAPITFGLLLAGLWVVVVGIDVFNATLAVLWSDTAVGQTAASGVVGLLVIAVTLGLMVVLYGELTETTPAPEAWPPER